MKQRLIPALLSLVLTIPQMPLQILANDPQEEVSSASEKDLSQTKTDLIPAEPTKTEDTGKTQDQNLIVSAGFRYAHPPITLSNWDNFYDLRNIVYLTVKEGLGKDYRVLVSVSSDPEEYYEISKDDLVFYAENKVYFSLLGTFLKGIGENNIKVRIVNGSDTYAEKDIEVVKITLKKSDETNVLKDDISTYDQTYVCNGPNESEYFVLTQKDATYSFLPDLVDQQEPDKQFTGWTTSKPTGVNQQGNPYLVKADKDQPVYANYGKKKIYSLKVLNPSQEGTEPKVENSFKEKLNVLSNMEIKTSLLQLL